MKNSKRKIPEEILIQYINEQLPKEEMARIEEILNHSEEDSKYLEQIQEVIFFEALGKTLQEPYLTLIKDKVLNPHKTIKIEFKNINPLKEIIQIWEGSKKLFYQNLEWAFRSEEKQTIHFDEDFNGNLFTFIITSGQKDELYLSIIDKKKSSYKANLYKINHDNNIILLETIENLNTQSMFESTIYKKGHYILEFISQDNKKFYLDLILDTY